MPVYYRALLDDCAVAKLCVFANMCLGADFNVGAELCTVFDYRSRMNFHGNFSTFQFLIFKLFKIFQLFNFSTFQLFYRFFGTRYDAIAKHAGTGIQMRMSGRIAKFFCAESISITTM